MSTEWQSGPEGRIHEVKHRKKWELNQTLKYYHYVMLNKSTLQVPDRNKKHQVYNRMAKCIATRNTHQCRSHHQKIVKRYKSIDHFCKTFRNKHPELFQSPKSENVSDSNSDSKKLHSSLSSDIVKNEEKRSSQNMQSFSQTDSFSGSESEKGSSEAKEENSELSKEKEGKSIFSDVKVGNEKQEKIKVESKQKRVRKKRRDSHRMVKMEVGSGEFAEKSDFFMGQGLNTQQNFPPTFGYQMGGGRMSYWNEMGLGSYGSPAVKYQEELGKLTNDYLNRVSMREGLDMIEDAMRYLTEVKYQTRKKIDSCSEVSFLRRSEHSLPRSEPPFIHHPYNDTLLPPQPIPSSAWAFNQIKSFQQEGAGSSRQGIQPPNRLKPGFMHYHHPGYDQEDRLRINQNPMVFSRKFEEEGTGTSIRGNDIQTGPKEGFMQYQEPGLRHEELMRKKQSQFPFPDNYSISDMRNRNVFNPYRQSK